MRIFHILIIISCLLLSGCDDTLIKRSLGRSVEKKLEQVAKDIAPPEKETRAQKAEKEPIDPNFHCVPEVRDGEPIGIKIVMMSGTDPMSIQGFQKGDILTAVNDKPIKTFWEFKTNFMEAARSGGLSITFEREGSQRIIHIDHDDFLNATPTPEPTANIPPHMRPQ